MIRGLGRRLIRGIGLGVKWWGQPHPTISNSGARGGGGGAAVMIEALEGRRLLDATVPTGTDLQIPDPSGNFGEVMTWTASVYGAATNVGDTVTFYTGSYPVGVAPVDADQVAVLNISDLPVGLHNIFAHYDGNAMLLPSWSASIEVTVNPVPTTITISAASTTVWGNSVSISATVVSDSGMNVDGGNVTFRIGAEVLGTVAVVDGAAEFSLDAAVGIHLVTASYDGTVELAQSVASGINVQIVRAGTTVVLSRDYSWIPKGQFVQWTAKVASVGAGGAEVGASVRFKDGKGILGYAPVVDGVARFRSRALPVGDRLITATYVGSGELAASTSKALKTTVVAATTVTVMVLYTPDAFWSMDGPDDMTQLVRDSVWGTNLALWNSRVPVVIRLVYSGVVNYVESGKLSVDLTRLTRTNDGYMDQVHTWRNQYKADLVTMLEYDGDAGGLAWEMTDTSDPTNDDYGFSIVLAGQSAAPYYSLAHELGHNLGASHDYANSGGPGATSFSYGYRFRGVDGVLYHDVMAYDPGTTIPYFSNPRVKYKGVATGTARADSARTIGITAPVVAGYRR